VGLTPERLAWNCDLDKGFLSQVESGKRMPSVAVLLRLARRLKVEVADVVAYDKDHPRLQLLDAARRSDRAAVLEALKALLLT
jgi:transcriptional regulator with XRE-family HTH domain